MSAASPLVSIALPVYNAESFLLQTLEALLAQDYPNLELMITDNASTDGTGLICRKFAEKNRRVLYFRNPKNVGMLANGNRALAQCSGKYILLAGAHDLYDRGFVRSCVELFQANPQGVLCATRIDYMDQQGKTLSTLPYTLETHGLPPAERFRRTIYNETAHYAICGMLRRSALRQPRPIPEVFFPDYVMVAELALRGEILYTGATTMFLRTFSQRDVDESEDERVKIARLISPERAQTMKGWILARFPFLHSTLYVLRALYGSDLPLAEKLKLTADAPGWRRPNVVRELTTRWLPWRLRRCLKAVPKARKA